MSNLKYKTRGMANPRGLSRVYFACHREDFEKYFEELSDEILKKQNCAVWYPEELDSERDEEYLDRLSEMQLFVIPVTAKLLFDKNPVVTTELSFAKEKHIPVLPIMMETGLEAYFNEKFGELQFLDKFSTDTTAISYDEKLTKYLESVLVGDELAKRIRDEFDAYIFLSYRKKDRRHAQELMRLIHERDFCRDIAIWYDEYLTPGENFNDSIKEAFDKSELFVLAVTPNLVNEENYVMTVEYPMAREAGKPILPAELVETDKALLSAKYDEIPKCVSAHNPEELSSSLKSNIDKMVKRENDNSPEHNYLIGLAYLNGVDVEVDHERALKLITSSADAGYVEAVEKLDNIASEHSNQGDWQKALELYETVYSARCRLHGKEHSDTAVTLMNMAFVHLRLREYTKALELNEEAYAIRCRVLGDEHPSTLESLSGIAECHTMLDDDNKALELYERVYKLRYKVLGEEHPSTLESLLEIARSYRGLGECRYALEVFEKLYGIYSRVFGEDSYETLRTSAYIREVSIELEQFERVIDLCEKEYNMYCRIYGEEHIVSLMSLEGLGDAYGKAGNDEMQTEIIIKVTETITRLLFG